jgi:hypothetical protein
MIALNRAVRVSFPAQPRFGRLFGGWLDYLSLLLAGIADGFDMARQARRRYPFADW